MEKLKTLTEKKIEKFAGKVIFNRGRDYYRDGLVEGFELNPFKNSIQAHIQGSIGIYSIEIWEDNDYLEAYCDCPFDGYPCKHIVAVLLFYLNNKESYIKRLEKERKIERLVQKKLFTLKKDELVTFILSSMKKHPSFRRELFLHLAIGTQEVLKQFHKQVDKALRAFDHNTFSPYIISHKLKKIIKQAQTADYEIQVEILWKIIDGVLYQLNTFGMSDRPLENIVLETMDLLIPALNNGIRLKKRRVEIMAELEEYCEWGNCGIVDEICEAVAEISDTNE